MSTEDMTTKRGVSEPVLAAIARAPGPAALAARAPSRARRLARQELAWVVVRALSDGLALLVAAIASGLAADPALGGGWHWALVPAVVAALALSGTYGPAPRPRPVLAELPRVAVVAGCTMLLAAAVAVLGFGRTGAGDAVAVHWLVATGLLGTGRVLVATAERTAWRRSGTRGRTLVVGAGTVGRLTAKRLGDDRALGLTPVGFLDKDPLDAPEGGLPVLGASWDLERVVREQRVDHVVVAFSNAPHHVLLDVVRRCWSLGVDVMVVPRLYEVEGRRATVEHLGALPMVTMRASDPRGRLMELKYAVDRVAATVALGCLLPLLAGIAAAVRLTMGGPVLFRQRRVGRDGEVFDMLKFRTMRGSPGSHGEADAGWAALAAGGVGAVESAAPAQDDRRTPLGRILRAMSLDELPQLWNVARGDMSLVGPRPERVSYVEQFDDAVYRYPDRHRVKSGLTGWAQIHGLRGETSLTDRVEWDNFYIENWSPWLDLKILIRTVPALLGRESR